MEIQIPLILFTSFLAWSAGIFASQGILAIKGQGTKAQLPSLILAVAVLAIGGICVCFHLAQPLHIFNGFGNLTSGITQELIVIVVMAVVMVIYFVLLRRNDKVPAWCAILAIIVAIVLDVIMSHSYMMAARPAWNNALQIISIIGASCVAGPGTVALMCAIKGEDASLLSPLNLIGTIVGAITTIAYLVSMNGVATSGTSLGIYFDPTTPNAAAYSWESLNVFAGDCLAPTLIAIICSVAAVAAAFAGKKIGWKVAGPIIAVCGVAAAIALRIVFYVMGISGYNFY